MKKSVLFLSVLLMAIYACKKDEYKTTTIRGQVKNGITNELLADAFIYVQASWQGKDGVNLSESFSEKTDQQGEFNIGFSVLEEAGIFMTVHKDGYITEPFYYPENGDDNFFHVRMFALDGHLRLKMINETGLHDSLYVHLVNPTIRVISNGWGYVGHPQKYPLVLEKDSSWTQVFSYPSDEHTYLSWGFYKDSLPFTGAVFLAQGDTADYTISF